MAMYSALVSIFLIGSVYAACKEGINNKFIVESTKDKLPVIMSNLIIHTYDGNSKPACFKNKPNVVLPGYALLVKGQVMVPQKFTLKNNTLVKMTVKSKAGDEYCKHGKSTFWFIPSRWCVLNLCEFIGDDLCEVLEKPGIHTVKELVEKANFNPKLKLPDPPCLFVICATDFFGGEWEIDFYLEYKGKTMLHFKVPARDKYLQVAVEDDGDD